MTLTRGLSGLLATTIAIVALAGGPGAAAAEARGCHSQSATNLFLRHGIHTVTVANMTCRRAVRTLGRWARSGMRDPGPSGWRCRATRLNVQVERVRCSRRGRRMRFHVGGG
jgi:hypothetical protein